MGIVSNQGRINVFNKPLPLVDYLLPFVENKKELKIADIGSGPFSIIGSYLDGVDIEFHHCDKQDFKHFWETHEGEPLIKVEIENMEKLSYPDNYFDIVHCCNALDHTRNAEEAVKEMIRICKVGGYVYIRCSLDQLSTGYLHFWNAKQDGLFTNNKYTFDLKAYGFEIEFIDNGGESRYNMINATLHKK